ncbi:MAG: sensor histidine kinase [Solobacterium sp.]|nr:sensor histidine kinase [Solobacterium sp.]
MLLTFFLSRVIIALVLWLVAGYTGRHLYDAGKTGMAFTIAFTAMYFITIHFEGLILSESPEAELLTVINLVILVFVLFVYFVFLHFSRTVQIEKENALIDSNIKYYQQNMEQFRKREEELRTIRHDMKGSLVLIQAEIDNGRPEEASSYIHEKLGEINQAVLPVRSGNLLVDTVLSNFLTKAEEKGIHPLIIVTVGTLSPSQDRDLALILTNLTDNIIENTDREKKEARLELTRSENQICIRMSNTTDNKEIRSRKADHENHGIGLKSVQRIVEQYHGTSDIYLQDGVCYQEYVLFI